MTTEVISASKRARYTKKVAQLKEAYRKSQEDLIAFFFMLKDWEGTGEWKWGSAQFRIFDDFVAAEFPNRDAKRYKYFATVLRYYGEHFVKTVGIGSLHVLVNKELIASKERRNKIKKLILSDFNTNGFAPDEYGVRRYLRSIVGEPVRGPSKKDQEITRLKALLQEKERDVEDLEKKVVALKAENKELRDKLNGHARGASTSRRPKRRKGGPLAKRAAA